MAEGERSAFLAVTPLVLLALYAWSRKYGFFVDVVAVISVRAVIAIVLALLLAALHRALVVDGQFSASFSFRRVTLIWVNVIVIVHILVSLWLG